MRFAKPTSVNSFTIPDRTRFRIQLVSQVFGERTSLPFIRRIDLLDVLAVTSHKLGALYSDAQHLGEKTFNTIGEVYVFI